MLTRPGLIRQPGRFLWHDGKSKPVLAEFRHRFRSPFLHRLSTQVRPVIYLMPSISIASASPDKVATLFVAALALVAALPVARADLISSESFSGYNTGALNATTPSPTVPGYAGNWTAVDFGTAQPAISFGSLTYAGAHYLGSTGDKVSVPSGGGETSKTTSGRVYRLLDSSLAVIDATTGTRYLSFLFQSGQETGATIYQTLALYDGPVIQSVDTNRTFDAGITTNGRLSGTQYSYGLDNTYANTGVAADTAVHLFVVKFDLSLAPNRDTVTVWIDPDLSGVGDPSGGVMTTGLNITFDRLVLSDYDGNSANWDEIRWATTFADVVTFRIPEPSTYAVGAWGR